MRIQNSLVHYIFNALIGILVILLLLLNSSGTYEKLVGYCVIAINILSMVKVRHNWYLLFIFLCITYSNYSICVANYISHIDTFFAGYAGTEIGSQGVNILLLFSAMLLFIAPTTYREGTNKASIKPKALITNNKYNPIIVIGAIIILGFIWVYGFTRPDAVGHRGSPSALYEYSIIFMIIALYYSGKDRILTSVVVLIGLAFAIQNFMFGGRITGVQILIMIGFAVFIDHISLINVAPVGIVFFIIMVAIGQLRGNILISGFSVNNVINQLAKGKFALDTAYSSYFTSMTFLDELHKTVFSRRIQLFLRWLLSIFLGGSVTDSNLAVYTRQTHMHYYGGVLPYFAWFYLGFIGLVLLTIYIRFHFKVMLNVNCDSSGFIRCMAVYVTCTCLRWYLYSPSQLFRGVFLLSIVFFFCYEADRLMKKQPIRIHWKRMKIIN